MRRAFTLIELVFVIVIIGILAAFAIPKFSYLKINADVANMVRAYTAITKDGTASYLNARELNNLSDADINVTTLMKIAPIRSERCKGWFQPDSSNPDSFIYYIRGCEGYMEFDYKNNGKMLIYTKIYGVHKDKIQEKLHQKLGLIFDNDENRTWVDFYIDE